MKCHHCESKAIGRGLCRRHYQQAWKDKTLDVYETENGGEHTIKRRLLAKYKVTPNGCWEWTGQRRKDKFDYGLLWIGNGVQRAHRVSYEIHKGPIPEGLDILHSCDNPPCINPAHLSIGTRGENCSDCASKNRFPLDEKHWNTKLTVEDIVEIKVLSKYWTYEEVAAKFDVTPSHISRIMSGKRRSKSGII